MVDDINNNITQMHFKTVHGFDMKSRNLNNVIIHPKIFNI